MPFHFATDCVCTSMNIEECRTVNDDQTSVRSLLTPKFGKRVTIIAIHRVVISIGLCHHFGRPLPSVFQRHRSDAKEKNEKMSKLTVFGVQRAFICGGGQYNVLISCIWSVCINDSSKKTCKHPWNLSVHHFGTSGVDLVYFVSRQIQPKGQQYDNF